MRRFWPRATDLSNRGGDGFHDEWIRIMWVDSGFGPVGTICGGGDCCGQLLLYTRLESAFCGLE